MLRPALPLMLAVVLFGCSKGAPPAPAQLPPAPVAEEVVPDARFCARPPEKTALEMAGLKSRLMVAALSCGGTEKYNEFITKNRPALVAQEKALASYFSRNYGRRGQSEQDDYITALANMQSQRRTRDAATFCEQAAILFSDVGAIKGSAELPPLASARKISQPMNVTECSSEPTPPARPAATTRRAPAKR
jgi:hypothetical protein